MNETRVWLTDSLRKHLLPALIKQGFNIAEPAHPPTDRKYIQAFPLGRMIRARGSGVDHVSIQFATRDRSAFRINATIVPPKEIIATHNRLPETPGILARGLSEHFEMYESPLFWGWLTWGWFSVRHWTLRSPVQHDYEELALRVTNYLPELELALREGRLGPHMRRMLFPYYVQKNEAAEL